MSTSTKLLSENRRELPAVEVFAKSIQCLMKKLMLDLDKRCGGVNKDEIFFVLTVPAIWSDNAKQFMRQAALMVQFIGYICACVHVTMMIHFRANPVS